MDFELSQLDFARAATRKGDALIVVVPKSFKAAGDVLSDVVAGALKAGDLEPKAGKLLQLYRTAGVSCSRVVLAGVEDGTVRQARQAIAAACGAIKSSAVKRVVVCFGWPAAPDVVHGAVMAVAEATYVYTTTKSKPEGRSLAHVCIGVAQTSQLRVAPCGQSPHRARHHEHRPRKPVGDQQAEHSTEKGQHNHRQDKPPDQTAA